MVRMSRSRTIIACLLLLAAPQRAAADWELSLFLGRAYPTLDDLLVIRLPGVPAVPGLEVQPHGTPQIGIDGGRVLGGALAWHIGVVGFEGRLDAVHVGFDLTGARYDLRLTAPPLAGATGSITIGNGRFDAERLHLLSLNARLRTPGPISLVASGGPSYLPSFDITGTAPVQVQLEGLPVIPPQQPRLRLRVAPGQAAHRFGLNGGLGLRTGGRVGVFGEARIFYFRPYELHAVLEDAPALVDDLLGDFEIVRFEPIIVNAVAGLVIRF
jgi:hypothetical protein